MTFAALSRFRVMAYVTGVVLALGALFGLQFWPWYVGESKAGILWTAHGWLYILYVVAAFQLAYQQRWKAVKTVLVLLAGTVPFMSFVAERRVVADLRREAAAEKSADPAGAAAPPAPPA